MVITLTPNPNAMVVDRQKTLVTCYNCRKTGHISQICLSPATPKTPTHCSTAPKQFQAFSATLVPALALEVDVASLVEEIAKLQSMMSALQEENKGLRQEFCTGKE